MEKVLAIIMNDSLYVAGVFTKRGLYSSSLPRTTLDDVEEAVGGKGLPRTDKDEHLEVLEAAYAIWEGRDYPNNAAIKLDYTGMTEKQIRIAKAARKIEKGSTMTYGELAEEAGLPNAARFAGNAMAKNRQSPFVPCHRVVAKNGLGGFGAGLSVKAQILKREGAFAD